MSNHLSLTWSLSAARVLPGDVQKLRTVHGRFDSHSHSLPQSWRMAWVLGFLKTGRSLAGECGLSQPDESPHRRLRVNFSPILSTWPERASPWHCLQPDHRQSPDKLLAEQGPHAQKPSLTSSSGPSPTSCHLRTFYPIQDWLAPNECCLSPFTSSTKQLPVSHEKPIVDARRMPSLLSATADTVSASSGSGW